MTQNCKHWPACESHGLPKCPRTRCESRSQHSAASLADVLERDYHSAFIYGASLFLGAHEWRMVVDALRAFTTSEIAEQNAAPQVSAASREFGGANMALSGLPCAGEGREVGPSPAVAAPSNDKSGYDYTQGDHEGDETYVLRLVGRATKLERELEALTASHEASVGELAEANKRAENLLASLPVWRCREGQNPELFYNGYWFLKRSAKLTKPAQVGNTVFGVGVKERMVIERAQREHEYQQTPERKAERIARGREKMDAFTVSASGESALLPGLRYALAYLGLDEVARVSVHNKIQELVTGFGR